MTPQQYGGSLQTSFDCEYNTFGYRTKRGDVKAKEARGRGIVFNGRLQGCSSGRRMIRRVIVNAPAILEMEIMYTNEFSYTTPSQFEAVLNINGGVHWRSLCKVQDKYIVYDGMGMSSDSPNMLAWWLESKSFGRNWKAVKLWFVPEPELINGPEKNLMAKRTTIAAGYPDGVSIAPKRRERRAGSDFCKSCGKGVAERTPCLTVQKTTNGRCEAAYHHLPNCCKDLQPIADEVMAAVEESPYSGEEKEKLRDSFAKFLQGRR